MWPIPMDIMNFQSQQSIITYQLEHVVPGYIRYWNYK